MITKSIFSDVTALYAAHGARYLFIIITLPYLANILGPQNFGVLLFFQSLGLIVSQIVEYGFAYNGTRLVSQSRDDKSFLTSFLSSVLLSQVIVFFVCIVFISILYYLSDIFGNSKLLIFTLLASFFQSVSLNWFLRGLGKAVLVAKLEVLAKTVALCMVFLLVKSQNDIANVMLAFLIGNVIAFVLSFWAISSLVSPKLAKFRDSLLVIKEGWNAFLVRAGGSILSDGNVMVASLVLNPTAFGLFAGIYKIVSAVRGLFVPLVDALFPYFTRSNNHEDIGILVKKFAPVLLVIGASLSLLIFLFAEMLIRLLLSDEFLSAAPALKIFAILPFIIAIVHGFGTQWLVALGKEKIYSKIVIVSGLIGLCFTYVLTKSIGMNGAIVSILLSYALIAFVVSLMFANRRKFYL